MHVDLRIKVDAISVQDFIRELGKKVVWGSRQEVELCTYVERQRGQKYRRITTVPQLVEAIVAGRRANGDPEQTIYAELTDGSEDSPLGIVRSQAADALLDAAFLAESQPVSNVADFGQNSTNGPSVDYSQVDIDEPADFAPQIYCERKWAELLGIPLPDEQQTLPPPPPQPRMPPEQCGDDEDEVARMFEDGGDVIDDMHEEEMRTVHDEDNPDISVGTFWSSMEELKMAFRSYALKKEFQGRTAWTNKNRFTAKCRGKDGNMLPCRWYMSARRQPDGRLIRVNRMPHKHTYQSQWPEVELGVDMHAPNITRKAGRPKQKRFKNFFERGGNPGTKGQMKGGKWDNETKEKTKEEKAKEEERLNSKAAIGIKHRCKKCLEIGHCVNSPLRVSTPLKPRGRGQNKTAEGAGVWDEDAPHLEKCKSCLEPGHRAGSSYCILTPPKTKGARGRKKKSAAAPAENAEALTPAENAEDWPAPDAEDWLAKEWTDPNAEVAAENVEAEVAAEKVQAANAAEVEVQMLHNR
ncbi:hypothetical protein BRADI_5g08813v3 [Brachypodium distachyon]|uniref:Transposase MuDR plant domain-containing protein n=1 Tax=Brachypodium distachyon TaxID=15368 RepID=A0A2K2CG30_BRADI|nr:hypothetical protein BRADI_5g08813v3 [Brachypodium distachyon]